MSRITISKTPKVRLLNSCLTEILTQINNDVLTIIFEYFVKCNGCQNYFNEEKTYKCACATWCRLCIGLYTKINEENDENDEKEKTYACTDCMDATKHKKITERPFNKCFVKKCGKYAKYGDERYAYYCKIHASDKILICHYFMCDSEKCNRLASYVNKVYDMSCKLHKNSTHDLYLCEGENYKHKNKQPCESCDKKCRILVTCSCGIKRCNSCARVENITGNHNDTEILLCIKCIYTQKQIRKLYSISADVMCNVKNCIKYTKYYNHTDKSHYCESHYNTEYCVAYKDKCKYEGCKFIKYKKSRFCKYHKKEFKKYNTN